MQIIPSAKKLKILFRCEICSHCLVPRFEIPEKFLPVAGPEYSRNRNFDRNFDFVPVISGVF